MSLLRKASIVRASLFAPLVAGIAHAQAPAPVPPAPAAAPAPTTEPAPAPAPEPAAPATEPAHASTTPVPAPDRRDPDPSSKPETLPPIPPEPASPAAAAPSEPDASTIPGWFRFDSDLAGLSLWVGATHDLGGVGLATDVVVSSGSYEDIATGTTVPFSLAELDVGPAFAFVDGGVAMTPMVGIQFDWIQRKAVTLAAPQLFTIVNFGPVYFESWVQCFLYGIFEDAAKVRDNFYTRNFLLYKLTNYLALGPNVELTYLFDSRQVASLPVGGAVMLNYGRNSTLLLALGYETDEQARASSGGSGERAVAGRFTFIQTW